MEDLCFDTISNIQEQLAVDLLYNLIGTVNHKAWKNGGHYIAITKKANHWHCFNDAEVTNSNFRCRKENRTLMEFQRTASILFYCQSSTSSTSTNDHPQDGILIAAEPYTVATMTVTLLSAPAPESVAAEGTIT